MSFTTDAVPMGQPAPLFSGFLDEAIDLKGNDYSRTPGLFIRQDQPLPFSLLGMLTEMEVANDV